MKARTGETVWGFQFSKRGINSSVVVDGYRVYATHSEENHDSTAMGRVVSIDARGSGDVTKTHEIWRQDGVAAGYASPLLDGGRLYVMNNFGVLYCFDAMTGREIWQHIVGRVGKGSPVWADGKIYAPTVNGNLAILEDTGDKARQIDTLSFESEDGGIVELFGSPAVSDGRVVFFTSDEMVCLGREDAGPQAVTAAPLAAETPLSPNAEPAAIQVRPAEVLIELGERPRFKAVAFDEGGRLLGPVEVEWSYQGPGGSVDGGGRFSTAESGGSVGQVTAKFGELAAAARVRIVPKLPIVEDFESYDQRQMLSWWIGVSPAKHAIETVGGSQALKKLADERGPAFNRSRVYITPPLKPGYTVEADVMGAKAGRRRGDVGLINDRYRLELYGNVKRLRVMSWVPGPRFEKRVEFSWEPDRWYTMKFRVDVKDGEAHLFAKVWARDEAEPDDWTLEAVDPQPNLQGSAGIYAYSMAPVYYDNVRIYR